MNASHPSATSKPAHWAQKYVLEGRWVSGGREWPNFDCWGLLRWIVRHEFNRPWLPQYPIPPHKRIIVSEAIEAAIVGPDWVKLAGPIHGCAVGLSHNEKFHHVGAFVATDGGLVIHTLEGAGVVAQSVAQLRSRGWQRIEFYWCSTWSSPHT